MNCENFMKDNYMSAQLSHVRYNKCKKSEHIKFIFILFILL